ncbi:MAG: phosphotransferase [bacterium]|nr:phosphotransferase [bacterium]
MNAIIRKAIRNLGFHDNFAIQQLTEGGSTREFYRIMEHPATAAKEDSRKPLGVALSGLSGGKSIILLIDGTPRLGGDTPGDQEFENYIAIASVLKKTKTAVPEIYYSDKKEHFLLAEDIGDLSLELAIKKYNYPVLETYKQVIDTLLNMQIMGLEKSSHCAPIITRKFDYNTFRWETQYFTQYFLGKYCKMEHPAAAVMESASGGINNIENNQLLQTEFHNLAMRLVNEPFYFMHRDFQSKNIFLKQNRVYIVDFQGARQGLLAYDIASLLKDPYIVLEDTIREELINYYINSLIDIWKVNINKEQFKQIFIYTGLQRNMQALGAFAFLSLVKGKTSFLQYIPPGVNYLKKALSETTEFPKLKEIINSLPVS